MEIDQNKFYEEFTQLMEKAIIKERAIKSFEERYSIKSDAYTQEEYNEGYREVAYWFYDFRDKEDLIPEYRELNGQEYEIIFGSILIYVS